MPSLNPVKQNESPTTLSQMAKSLWLGWKPWIVGLTTLIFFMLPMLATIWNVYDRAHAILKQSIHQQLLGAAQTMAQTVDAEIHRTFVNRDQESSELYLREIERLNRAKLAVDPSLMVKFVYTCLMKGDDIRFVLDITPSGDLDQDGKDDKAHILEVYESPSETLREVLRTGIAKVDQTPYEDRWGTFLSGYAPIYDSHHALVGAAGVDMELAEYNLQLSGVRHVAVLSALAALSLSIIAGLGVAAYHRKLQRSVNQLVKTSDAALAAVHAKSDFLAAMSHELRTPMNAVLGMTELLKDTPLTEKQNTFIDTIRDSGEDLLDKITDILDFSQLNVGDIDVQSVPVDLRSLVDGLHDHFRSDLNEKSLSFDVALDSSCTPGFRGDPTHLKQLLRHLLSNAIRFTSHGGITLTANILRSAEARPTLNVTVSDTGMGMSSEQQAQLFQPLFQADRSTTRRQGGTGMGLAICKRLCEGMRGTIRVESQPGGGASFHVSLPIEDVAQEVTHRALIWSQDSMTRLLAARVVEKAGHHPLKVETSDELMTALREDRFRWVLIDAVESKQTDLERVVKAAQGAKLIALNAEAVSTTGIGPFDTVLVSPLKPAQLREALT